MRKDIDTGIYNRDFCKNILDMYAARCQRYEDLVFNTGYSEAEVTAAILWNCLLIMISITEEE